MKHCWNPEIASRANFSQLKTAFSELLEVFTNPSGSSPYPLVLSRERLNTPTSSTFQHSPVATPRRKQGLFGNHENLYSNRPHQIPNLYLNV
jgi:hypothetical protein